MSFSSSFPHIGVLCPYFPAVGPALSAACPAPVGGTGRGGAIRLVLGHPRLGGDGDMESGAYGAANAGGSFDLRRFVSQPQVVTRLVSMVSRPERTRSRASRLPGTVGRRPRSATGGGGGGASWAWRRARGPRSPPRLCPL